ncbi:MAG: hypothetical protein KDK89_17345 [Alphaproteobacteria bacterium]|nr:hypothetical protein [Alphaproteobacteria bacterium]
MFRTTFLALVMMTALGSGFGSAAQARSNPNLDTEYDMESPFYPLGPISPGQSMADSRTPCRELEVRSIHSSRQGSALSIALEYGECN